MILLVLNLHKKYQSSYELDFRFTPAELFNNLSAVIIYTCNTTRGAKMPPWQNEALLSDMLNLENMRNVYTFLLIRDEWIESREAINPYIVVIAVHF